VRAARSLFFEQHNEKYSKFELSFWRIGVTRKSVINIEKRTSSAQQAKQLHFN
jgi:hypothetical protein